MFFCLCTLYDIYGSKRTVSERIKSAGSVSPSLVISPSLHFPSSFIIMWYYPPAMNTSNKELLEIFPFFFFA